RVRIPGGQLSGLFQATRAQQVYRHRVFRGRREHPVDAGVGWIGRDTGAERASVAHDDPDADRTLLRPPVGNDVRDGRIVRIDRLDQAEPVRVLCLHFEAVARVV